MSRAPATKAPRSARKSRRDWRPVFLAAFAKTASVTQACAAAKIERSTAYRERQRDEDFALQWADVETRVVDDLEAEAVKRALDGSDRLLEFLLKARRPETYRENVKVEHSGTVAHDLASMSERDLRELADGLDEKRART